jgi:hypothetical protein
VHYFLLAFGPNHHPMIGSSSPLILEFHNMYAFMLYFPDQPRYFGQRRCGDCCVAFSVDASAGFATSNML